MTTCYEIPGCGGAVAIWGGCHKPPSIFRNQNKASGYFVSDDKVMMVGENHPEFGALLAHAIAHLAGFELPKQTPDGEPLDPMWWNVSFTDSGSIRKGTANVYYSGTASLVGGCETQDREAAAFWLCKDGDISESEDDRHNFFVEYHGLMLSVAKDAPAADLKYPPGEKAATAGHYNPNEQQKKERIALLQWKADGKALIAALSPHTLDPATRGHPERSRAMAQTHLDNAVKDGTECVMGIAELPARLGKDEEGHRRFERGERMAAVSEAVFDGRGVALAGRAQDGRSGRGAKSIGGGSHLGEGGCC